MGTSGRKLASTKPARTAGAYVWRFTGFGIAPSMRGRMFQAGEFCNSGGRATQLGEDGIGATLTGELETGEIVSLDIPLPLGPYPLRVRAIVRYRQGLRYGFEFLTLS